MARPGRRRAIALRLALAFVGVALTAVALLAGLSAALRRRRRSRTWSPGSSEPDRAVAWPPDRRGSAPTRGAELTYRPCSTSAPASARMWKVRDVVGRVAGHSSGFNQLTSAPERQMTVYAHGHRVGQVIVRFTGTGLRGADETLRADLWRAIAGAAGLAAPGGPAGRARGLAPDHLAGVTRLIGAARATGSGDRTARAGDVRGPGELRDLAIALDQMADSLARQETVRRNLVADVAHELRTPIAVLQASQRSPAGWRGPSQLPRS